MLRSAVESPRTDDVDSLDAGLDLPLPVRVETGRGSALAVFGACSHPTVAIEEIRVSLAGETVQALASDVPRPDRSAGRQARHRSGFWAIVPIRERVAPESAELAVEASLANGSVARATLGSIALDPGPPPSKRASGDRVAICMATFEPPSALFRRQIDSIRAQTHANWTCVISDDGSGPEALARMRTVLADDPRFRFVRNDRRLGVRGNFERALRLAPDDAPWIALSDQDDCWRPEKLEALLSAIGDASLVYSDARIVDTDGRMVSSTYWSERRNNNTNLASLVLTNSVSGAASLFRRSLLDLALPFPPAIHRGLFHDHWIAQVALSAGTIAYVDAPLYDYVQHDAAALGHERANAWLRPRPQLRARLSRFRRDPQYFWDHWRTTYFQEHLRVLLCAEVLSARCGAVAGAEKRRSLELLRRGDASLERAGWLFARCARTLVRNETLGAEGRMLRALAWRYALQYLTPRGGRAARWLPSNGVPSPPDGVSVDRRPV